MRPRAELAKSRWDTFRDWFNLAGVVVGSLVALTLVGERSVFALSSEGFRQFPLPQLAFLATLGSFWLIFGWWNAVHSEMRMLQVYGEEFTPVPPRQTFALGICIAILLGFLVLFSSVPIAFSVSFTSLKILEIIVGKLIASKFREGIRAARRTSAPDHWRRPAWDILESYYLGSPFFRLAVTETSIAVAGLLMAASGTALRLYVLDSALTRTLVGFAYVSFIIALVVNAFVIGRWRGRRDKGLERFEEGLD